MRAYFFGNMYLASIQQGIQAGHVIAEMAVKYQRTGDGFTPQGSTFYDWAENHKTMILLNAGYGENLHELNAFFEGTLDEPGVARLDDGYSPYPFSYFEESGEALDGAITSFGVILTPKIYDGCRAMRKVKRDKRTYEYKLFVNERVLVLADSPEEIQYTEWEVELMQRLGTFKLAQ